MRLRLSITLALVAAITLSAGCGKQDFCKYVSLREAQAFAPSITNAKMRQTKRLLYCVWGDGTSDKLFISIDRALKYHPQDFLKVLAKNSPEEKYEVVSIAGVGTEAAALFLGNADPLKLDFLIAQNSKYSVTIRAPDVTAAHSQEFAKIKEIASTVLSRI
jgi:hypothetical protein